MRIALKICAERNRLLNLHPRNVFDSCRKFFLTERKRPVKNLLLLGIILAGFLLRLYGSGHGLAEGRVYHPDTPKQIMLFRHYMGGDYRIRFRWDTPGIYGYPTFHMHLMEWTYRGVRNLAAISGYREWRLRPLQIWFLARFMTVLFSTASIVFVYLAGKTLLTEKAGLLAAGLFALHPFSVGISHFIMGDTAMTFFALAALFVFTLCFKKQSMPLFFLGGLFLGFSGAAKYNGLLMAAAGVFALFTHRNRRTFHCFLALAFGAFFGFTIGNPSMFTHFSEGIRGVLTQMGGISRARLGESETIAAGALKRLPHNAGIFLNLFGVVQTILLLVSIAWVFCAKDRKGYFPAVFTPLYFLMSVTAKPTIAPLHMLPLVPLSLIVIARFLTRAGRWKKPAGSVLGIFAAAVLSLQLYGSYSESYLFQAGDTRRSAEEWLKNNVPSFFVVENARYAVEDPHRGEDKIQEAGAFFVSSGLSGMHYPEGGEKVKKFSFEDGIPSVRFRNPDIKILAYTGEKLESGFILPLFNRAPMTSKPNAPVIPDGVDFGIDPFSFFLGSGRELTAVSSEPLDEIKILLVNFNTPAEVSMRVAGRSRRINLAPFESRLVNFDSLRRQPPYNRHRYRIRVMPETPGCRVFVRAALSDVDKAMACFEAGNFTDAAAYFKDARDSSRLCPAELAIMRACSLKMAGDEGDAREIASGLEYWAREVPEEAFEELFFEAARISPRYLEAVNVVRFGASEFASIRGEITQSGVKGADPDFSHVITCKEGEGDIIFGPYMPFPPGNYYARFVLSIGGPGAGTEVRLDVSSRAGGEMLAAKSLQAADKSGCHEFLLPFRIEKQTEFLEFRTALDGRGKLALDFVEVFPDIRRNTIDMAEILEELASGD